MALNTDQIRIKNLINSYDTLTTEQLYILSNLQSNTQKRLVEDLVKKQAIKSDYLSDGIQVYFNYFSTPNRKFALIGEVLRYLTENDLPIYWFQKQEYPFCAIAAVKNKMFDIAVVEEGEDVIFSSVINRLITEEFGTSKDDYKSAPAPRENLLIITENKQHIKNLKIIHKNVIYACVDLINQEVSFEKRGE